MSVGGWNVHLATNMLNKALKASYVCFTEYGELSVQANRTFENSFNSILNLSLVGRRRRVDLTSGGRADRGRAARSSPAGPARALVGQHLDPRGVPLERHVRVVGRLHQDSVLKEGAVSGRKGRREPKTDYTVTYHLTLLWVEFPLLSIPNCPYISA